MSVSTANKTAHRHFDENLLRRTAGPYIWVNRVAFAMPRYVRLTGNLGNATTSAM
jgi:hypothetical protein